MNCPVCGSEISSGTKYCNVCGTDVEAAQMRSQQATAAHNQAAVPQQNVAQQPTEPRYDAPSDVEPQPHYDQQQYVSQQQYEQQQYAQQQQYVQQQYEQQYAASQQADQQTLREEVAFSQQYTDPDVYQQTRAIPPNPVLSQQQARTIDANAMKSSTPKWPIVLIIILVIIIAVILLLIFHPWSETESEEAETAAVTETDIDVFEPVAVGLNDEEAYDVLQSQYAQLGAFDADISSVATDFNNYCLSDLETRQSLRDTAAQVQINISEQAAALNDVVLAEDSYYAGTLQTMKDLYTDLSNRIRVIVEAWDAVIAAGYDATTDTFSAILSADNVDGINIYKADFDARYPDAVPPQPESETVSEG